MCCSSSVKRSSRRAFSSLLWSCAVLSLQYVHALADEISTPAIGRKLLEEVAPYGLHHELVFSNHSILDPADGIQYYFSNVGFATYEGQSYITVRRWHAKKEFTIWTSKAFMCKLDMTSLSYSDCQSIEVPQVECIWLEDYDARGVEDARVFTWPNRGVYAIFGAKPPRQGRYPFCGKYWFVQYIAHILDSSSDATRSRQERADSSQDPWKLPRPVPLLLDIDAMWQSIEDDIKVHSRSLKHLEPEDNLEDEEEWQRPLWKPQDGGYRPAGSNKRLLSADDLVEAVAAHRRHRVRDKNWVPFVYNDTLYLSRSIEPHVVLQPAPDGALSLAHATDNRKLFEDLKLRIAGSGPRGSTPAVLVHPSVSKEDKPFYLGVLHYSSHHKDGYRNFFYRMEAEPPFPITKVSSDIPFKRMPVFFGNREPVAFPCGLEILPPDNRVLLSYGSGDHKSHLLILKWGEVVRLFNMAPLMKTED